MDYWYRLLNNILNLLTNPSWQQLILLFLLLMLCFFRQNISMLIDRIRKITPSSIDFAPPTQIAPPSSTVEELEKVETTFSNITTLKTINSNRETIKNYLDDKKLTDLKQCNDFLVRELADAYFILRCERIYFIIFGSQIELLKKLLNNQNTGLTHQQINEHFESIQKNYPDMFTNWNISSYLNFLTQANLIIKKDNYYITDFGADFLTWLQRSGYSENKFF